MNKSKVLNLKVRKLISEKSPGFYWLYWPSVRANVGVLQPQDLAQNGGDDNDGGDNNGDYNNGDDNDDNDDDNNDSDDDVNDDDEEWEE